MKENTKVKKDVKNVSKNKTEIKNKTKKTFKMNKKIYILIGCIALIILIFVISYFIIKNAEYKKYKHYEEKMNSYGFNRLYDNESSKTSEKVTKSEAIKMVIGTCLNTFDISGFAKEPTETYENAIWVLYAQDADLAMATELNKDTENKKAKYIEVIEYFANAKKKLLKQELSAETDKKLKDLQKYTEDQQEAIIDMLDNDILKVAKKKLGGNKNIFKGQLNEIVVNMIEKYNLLGQKIQTDETKLPSNAKEYAYISQDVAKEVYEIPQKVDVDYEVRSAKDSFTDLKPYYNQIISKIESYYNTILNIDYTTIDAENFKNTIKNLTISAITADDYTEYVNYVKANQIKISGKAKAQEPIIYFDGFHYRLRTKLDFKIESSLTNENILFYDLASKSKIKYDNKEYSVIVDTLIGSAFGTGSYYAKLNTLDNIIVGNDKPGIYSNMSNNHAENQTTEVVEQ